jgi:hypothetical protein
MIPHGADDDVLVTVTVTVAMNTGARLPRVIYRQTCSRRALSLNKRLGCIAAVRLA